MLLKAFSQNPEGKFEDIIYCHIQSRSDSLVDENNKFRDETQIRYLKEDVDKKNRNSSRIR